MKSVKITDPYIEKNGVCISKAKLLYIDESPKLCDGCDENKICSTIQAISTTNNSGDIIILCKDCLLEIISHF